MGVEKDSRAIMISGLSPESITTKFFRAGPEIVVFKKTGVRDPSHEDLTLNHTQQIDKMRQTEPAQLDAGHIQFLPEVRVLRIFDVSNTLGYPLPDHANLAREITAGILRNIFPDHEVHYTGNERQIGTLIIGDSGEETHLGVSG